MCTVAELPNQYLKSGQHINVIAPVIQYIPTLKLVWNGLRGVADKFCWSEFQYLAKKYSVGTNCTQS